MDIKRYDILQNLFDNEVLANTSDRVTTIIATARRRAEAARATQTPNPPAAKKSRADPTAGSGSTGGGAGSGTSGSETVHRQTSPYLPHAPASISAPGLAPTIVAASVMQSSRPVRIVDLLKIAPWSDSTEDS